MKLMIMSAAVVAAAGTAFGGTITTDFSGFANGVSVEGTTFNAGTAAEFVATSTGNNGGLRIFDTSPTGPNAGGPDSDLIVAGFGNALILQDNQGPIPNDAGEGGVMNFAFTAMVQLVSIDLIDIDRNASVVLTLVDADGDSRAFTVPDNWTGEPGLNGAPGVGTLAFDQNNQVGWMSVATFLDSGIFDLDRVMSLSIAFSGSAAIDNLRAFVVPLPAPAALGLAGLGLVAGVRRRATA